MSPTNGRRPGQRSAVVTFAPIVVAVCAIIVVREGIEALLPDLSTWVAFIAALVVGWLTYTAVERYLVKRNGPNGPEADA